MPSRSIPWTLARAEKGYADMLRLFLKAGNVTPAAKAEMRAKFEQLRERLDRLQERR